MPDLMIIRKVFWMSNFFNNPDLTFKSVSDNKLQKSSLLTRYQHHFDSFGQEQCHNTSHWIFDPNILLPDILTWFQHDHYSSSQKVSLYS